MILNEIGIELELFLLNKNNDILEPFLYGFPADEMGFLIELRSEHSYNPIHVINSIENLLDIANRRAHKMNLETKLVDFIKISPEFKEYVSSKYRHSMMPDHTKNLYGFKESHHTGIHDLRATAGLHVHFSSRNIDESGCTMNVLPVEKIVKEMDDMFLSEIKEVDRILGEYEMKEHGFEYRSLPATSKINKVCFVSIDILNKVFPYKENKRNENSI